MYQTLHKVDVYCDRLKQVHINIKGTMNKEAVIINTVKDKSTWYNI